ncbi:hypothetical protein DPMN_156624 [Dreissena polymorpha]|uniref:Uncharacterized protein n=1 Tax=Dreissena polymorpha TaxID=45954 RepID=A0A9D4J7R1_DREPO|nr:hypothetical protein DPMN_156624 [Dreissena polymorpha]
MGYLIGQNGGVTIQPDQSPPPPAPPPPPPNINTGRGRNGWCNHRGGNEFFGYMGKSDSM